MKKSHSKAKKYLWRLRKLQKKIDDQMLEVARLQMLTTGVRALSDGDKVQSTPTNTMENAILKLLDAELELERNIDIMLAQKREMVAQINSLSDEECVRILTLYFVLDMSFSRIEKEIEGMSRRTIFRLYDKGLTEFEEKYWEFM